ncbi:MAG: DUF2808 domain-containing protein [Leptolyngbyaceae cyanobacterium SM1_1_3]|nr:DUF2808 domain-containing protein [Leptolyngbyaceae cyanobacterium SM1_1_3]NJN03044.1 DUF2808 domain-containing protein [Leptolyngbyaceae cyanobacterium RM1_1_2]NJO08723.1 DUF2808 domain-containing protein [Leptolyngbyaceae cyanobacterium SL_1_1]
MASNRTKARFLASLMCSGLAISGAWSGFFTAPGQAQSGSTAPGFTIFGGVDPDFRLGYIVDNNTPRNSDARYYLQVDSNKVERGISEIEISYPEAFTRRPNGATLDPENIEIRVNSSRGGRNGETIPIESVTWDRESNRLEIYTQEVIPADTEFVVALLDVRNPRRYGLHSFNLRVLYQGDVVRRYIGTWQVEVAAERPWQR